jgi:hypothetical protein
MTVADITKLKKRAIQLLNAAPDSGYVSTPSGNATYAIEQEITDALLAGDQEVFILLASTPDHYMHGDIVTMSGLLLHGAELPGSLGWFGNVELNPVADGSGAWSKSYETSRAEILEAVEFQNDGIFGTSSTDVYPWHCVDKGQIFHTGGCARLKYVTTAIGSVCRSPENYENAILCAGLRLLRKPGQTSEFFTRMDALWAQAQRLIRSQSPGNEHAAQQELNQLSLAA